MILARSIAYVPLATILLFVSAAYSKEYSSAQGSTTCDNVRCAENHVCEMMQVQCIRAPCYPVPTCRPAPPVSEPVADPCATVRCKSGYSCVSYQPACFTTPCPRMARCDQASA